MKRTFNKWIVMLGAALLLAVPASPKAPAGDLAGRVHHELAMLPYVGVFDNLAFRVDSGVVTLFGEVTRPILKSDAEGVVKRLEGVSRVDNRIEVLPLSSFDDRIRIAAANAIFGYPALQRYGMGALPSIRIIVRNGEVTLEGVVSNQTDKNIVGIRANGVFGAFKVTNNLRVGA